MTAWTVDTNVPVVANGRHDRARPVSVECRQAEVRFLRRILDGNDRVVVDRHGDIVREYRARLNPAGQPGVGDRFYWLVLNDYAQCERASLPRRADGEYADLPQALIDAGFDRDDRKFAALAKREGIPVATAVDSDWLDARPALAAGGICVYFVCGRDPARWFVD